MSENHPIFFSQIVYRDDLTSRYQFFYFKKDWRKVVSIRKGKERKRWDGTIIPLTIFVTFSGLRTEREIGVGVTFPCAREPDIKAIAEKRWYGQRNGPSMDDGISRWGRYRSNCQAKIDLTIQFNWATNSDWYISHSYTRARREKTKRNNEEFFGRHFDRPMINRLTLLRK